MINLYCDIESYSSVDLKKFGAYAYSASPDFEILMCAWSIGNGPVEIAVGREEIEEIPGLRDPNVRKWAHNAPFERICFSRFFGLPEGEFLPVEEWEDSQALGAEAGLPKSLSKMARALGGEQKDEAGTRLINLFCKPVRGKRLMPKDRPEQWQEFIDYCIQDVVTLKDIVRKLPDWPKDERRVFHVDQIINDRGVLIDLELAQMAVDVDAVNQTLYRTELCKLLEIENAGSVQQIMKGLEKIGLKLPNLQQETVEKALERPKITEDQRRALILRQETALVASAKYQAALGSAGSDGRYRGGLRFFGAHTGRWSAGGVQLQNPPKDLLTPKNSALSDEQARQVEQAAVAAAILDLRLGLGAEATQLKALVRAMYVGPYSVLDYAAIEARILAWWAREMWAVEAFLNKRDIYTETAKRMGGLTRQQGKIAVLALGYGGSVGSLRGMGYGVGMTDEKVLELVHAWRRANPKIVKLWRAFESLFMDGGRIGVIEVERHGKNRSIILPSGRPIIYNNVGLSEGAHGPRIMFDGAKGFRTDTYGGRLVENVVQAMSRDVLARALVNLEAEGLRSVFHVHDEVVIEGEHDLEQVAALMCDVPWAKGLPLDAEGFHCDRYMKG